MQPLVVLTTVAADFNARALAYELVDRRLAACVNIAGPLHSVYRWEGRVTEDDEQLLLIKTSDESLEALKSALLAIHPYEVPEVLVLQPDEVASPYLEWLAESLSQP
jgi:periplasmic divalent cation tolerance protein